MQKFTTYTGYKMACVTCLRTLESIDVAEIEHKYIWALVSLYQAMIYLMLFNKDNWQIGDSSNLRYPVRNLDIAVALTDKDLFQRDDSSTFYFIKEKWKDEESLIEWKKEKASDSSSDNSHCRNFYHIQEARHAVMHGDEKKIDDLLSEHREKFGIHELLFAAERMLIQITAVNLRTNTSEESIAARAFAVSFHRRLHLFFNRNPDIYK